MAVNVNTGLIPISNGVQTVIDRIAEILVNEFKNQQALAVNAGADPDDYKGRVFTNRFQPFDQLKTDLSPVINIKESDSSTDLGVTTSSGNYQKVATFFIDCLAGAKAVETEEGHDPSDLRASIKCRSIANLTAQILRSNIHDNLQLDRKIVNSVVLVSEQYFEPDFDSKQFESVVAKRITLQCKITDIAMVNDGVPLESIVIDITRDDTGEIYTTCEYDYT